MKINIQQVSHQYDVEVLKTLSFTLEGYRSIAIIGASGSGKSTLLRLLSGLEKPSQGTIQIDDLNVRDEQYRKQIGFVFQNHNLFPHLSLERNISLILEKTRGYQKAKAVEIAKDYLARVRLQDQMYKLPKNVSGGQAQRASIARAFSLDPELVFLDEPTASLDPVLAFEVLQAVKELRGSGKNFIFVTHVLTFVQDFADYVIFMDQGKILEHGPVAILEKPVTDELINYMSFIR
ncbi:MAG: amino acid ABC transporter ATP-binding protein [Firmicutes bacterium]|nr:amino acid ABC transporter ATP-binding protein [Bacillota bacterium]